MSPGHHAAAANGLNYEINVAGGAAKGRRYVPGVEVIIADGAAKRQIQMRMNIDAAGHQIFAGAIHNLMASRVNISPDQRNHFTLDQHIGLRSYRWR